jgi:hypothetical protein
MVRKCDFLWRCFGGSNEMLQINAELNPICHLLALLGAHPTLHVNRIRVNYIWHFVIYVWVFTVVVSYSSVCNALIASKHTLTPKLTKFTHIALLKWKSWVSVYIRTTGYAFTARRIRTSKKHEKKKEIYNFARQTKCQTTHYRDLLWSF